MDAALPPIENNVSLKDYNSFGLDITSRYFIRIDNIESLQALLTQTPWQRDKFMVLGGGSNVLFTQDFPGLIIKIDIPGINVVKEDNEAIWLRVGAGQNWHELVLYCVAHHYGGIENLALIPGTAGAAPMQNIGAYGVEICNVFSSLNAMNINTREIEQFSHAECEFAYRNSIFKNHLKDRFIITDITLKLSKKPMLNTHYGAIENTLQEMNIKKPDIAAISKAVIKIRSDKLPDPQIIGNAGSFFKNPILPLAQFQQLQEQHTDIPYYKTNVDMIKIPAAWLIEQCGWKGQRRGDAGVHHKQALVLVNHGAAEGLAIKTLAYDIQQSVYQKFNIQLHTEVNIIQ